MRTRDENFITMANSTEEVLNINQSTWNLNVPFSANKEIVTEALNQALGDQQGSGIVSKGYRLSKNGAAARAIAKGTRLAGMAQAFARDQKNKVMETQLTVTAANLSKQADNVLGAALKDIYDSLMENAGALEAYGVSAAELGDFYNAFVEFEGQKNSPRIAIVKRKGHNANIPELISVMRDAFVNLDGLVRIWETTHPQFVMDYFNARIIIDLGARKRKVKGGDEGKDA